jgi:hypothetical protein
MDDVVVTKDLIPSKVPADRWVVKLSNGETVYEDRIADLPPSWDRLAKYCEANGLYIVGMKALVGGCEVELPDNQDGYVQFKKVQSTGSWSAISMCIGFIQGGVCKLYQFASDHSSQSFVMPDPGAPKAIYKKVECVGEKA